MKAPSAASISLGALFFFMVFVAAVIVVATHWSTNSCFEYESKGQVSPFVSTVVVNGKLLVCHDASNGSVDAVRCVEMKGCPEPLPSEENP